MAKIVPIFSNFLHILEIDPELVLISLGGHRECIQDIKIIVE